MSKIPVHSLDGKAVGSFDLDEACMVLDRGEQAVHDYVVRYMANRRAGTASTKTRGLVAGGGAKPYKQKGTGRARAGSSRSPIWRGGGTVFGPHPRSFARGMNKKTTRLAFRRAFSEKITSASVRVIEGLALEEPKTRALVDLLKKQDVIKGALIVLAATDRNIELAARNIPGIEVVTAEQLNVYQLLRYPLVLTSREAMDILNRRMQPAGRAA